MDESPVNLDQYSMLELFDLQENFLNDDQFIDDRINILDHIGKQLISVVRTIHSRDFTDLKVYKSTELCLNCCDELTRLKLDKLNRNKS